METPTIPKKEVKQSQALEELTADIKSSNLKIALETLIKYDLARFQVDATKKANKYAEREAKDAAMLISAGTGGGKTLAFYVPVLSKITEAILNDQITSDYVKSLAIYPRNELLKDQFTEVYREVRRLDQLLQNTESVKLKLLFWSNT